MEPQQITYDVCRSYLNDRSWALTCGQRNQIQGNLRSRNLKALCEALSLFDPENQGIETFRTLLQITAFFKKNAAFADVNACTEAARLSFMEAERQCQRTNKRLDWYYANPSHLDSAISSYLERMQQYVHMTLGSVDRFIEDLPRLIKVTDGATASSSRIRSLPYLKVKRRYECPPGTVPFLRSLATFYGYKVPRIRPVSENRVEVVPKNWKTFRTIACEPDGALPFQLAFDTFAKRRLRARGINLSDQSRNQLLAKEGSINGSLATIDLSSASDTVAFNTVALLFPTEWFDVLNAFRSTHWRSKTFGNGSYQKFSSMGNGSTFAIETIVFAAACWAVGSRKFSVYGDDIIIETELVDPLLRILSFLGFTVNKEKSYWSGPFRESCGSHWFQGQLVTPFYIRDEFRHKSDLSHIINGLAALSPYGSLWKLLKGYLAQWELQLVPFNDVSTSGVWIDIHLSYKLKLVRWCSRRSLSHYQRYCPKDRITTVSDVRTLFLWYLDAYRVPYVEGGDARLRSRQTLSTHRYVRRWVSWLPPARLTPDHLYGWSEYITH